MNKDQREILRKLRILRHAADLGSVAKNCRYFCLEVAAFFDDVMAIRSRAKRA